MDETKIQFANALKELMHDKPINKVSVSDIALRAGLSRKSFYNYFQDKYDLINWICYSQFVQLRTEALSGGGWEAFREFLEFFSTDSGFFSNAIKDMGQNSFGQYFSDLLFEIVYEALHDGFVRQGISERWACLSIGALVEDARLAIIVWLDESSNPSADELIEFLRKASGTFASMICFERALVNESTLCERAIDDLTETWTYEPNKETFRLPTPDERSAKRREYEMLHSKYGATEFS